MSALGQKQTCAVQLGDVRFADISGPANGPKRSVLAEKISDDSCQSKGPHAGECHHCRCPADKFAASREWRCHAGETSAINAATSGTDKPTFQCRLCVKSGHMQCKKACPLCPRKRTFAGVDIGFLWRTPMLAFS